MMLTKDKKRDQSYELVLLDDLVPKNHLVRKLDKHIKFDFIYKLVEPLYCQDNGRPSVDPVVLFKMVFVSYLFGIRSMRRTVEEIQTNMAYRWFLGLKITDPVPHFTTFGKNYERRFKDTTIFQDIFDEIVDQALQAGLIDAKEFFSDSTHLKANANKKKFNQGHVKKDAKKYKRELEKEINIERKKLGKEAFEDKDDDEDSPGSGESKTTKISTTDPESGFMHRDHKPQGFFYLDHRTVDGAYNIIVDSHITPGNVHDSVPYTDRMERIKNVLGLKPLNVALDSGYMANHIARYLFNNDINYVFGYRRFGKRKPGKFSKYDFFYVDMFDYYVCPNMKPLYYSNIDKNGYKHYRPEKGSCAICPLKEKCLSPSTKSKVMFRHLWQDYLDIALQNKRTEEGRELYHRRGETVERSFADSKELHGLRYARYRGIKKVTMQSLLTSACQNMKKIAIVLDRFSLKSSVTTFFTNFLPYFQIYNIKTSIPEICYF